MIKKYRDVQIYFGDASNELNLMDIKQSRYSSSLQKIFADMKLNHIITLRQLHAAFGVSISSKNNLSSQSLYEHKGDFLITNLKKCGLVVLTADCLPIIFHDRNHSAVGIVHSGWKGSFAQVAIEALKMMQQEYETMYKDVRVFFGASAQDCCYEVGEEFFDKFSVYDFAHKAFIKRNDKLYFNNKVFVTLQLKKIGISPNNIYDEQPLCTICHDQYSSFRRQKDKSGRQATVVALI